MRHIAIAVVLATVSLAAYYTASALRAETVMAPIPAAAPYAPQKVVYHVTAGGGWFGRDHRNRLQSMENHVAALLEGGLTMAVVLQGDGIDLLRDAKSNDTLASRVDRLRAKGVKFLVCRNTLLGRGIGLDALHGVRTDDVVGAGVAEVTRLQQQGYGYIRF